MAEHSVIAVLRLFAGWEGGTLVYDHGVGMGPEASADEFR
jgi:uncharacterized membrane protein